MGVTIGNGYTLTYKKKGRYKDMTKEHFENNTNWKMSYEEFQKCDCTQCDNKDCVHRKKWLRMYMIGAVKNLVSMVKNSSLI